MRLLAFALACLLAPAAFAAPTRVEASYRISASGIVIGTVTEVFVRKGNTYRIESTTRAEGVLKLIRDDTVTLSSEGNVNSGGLQPLRFEQRMLKDPGRNILADFDWQNSMLRSEYRGEHITRALPPRTQDRLSIMYQFMFSPPSGAVVSLHMSNGRKVDLYAYRKVDEPRVSTPAGTFATTHYERITESKSERRAELWLASEHFNLPVRVEFEDSRGLKLEQTIVSLATR